MTVRIADGIIHLAGHCAVEDAEPLLVALTEAPSRRIDLSEATRLHSAVVQVLLVARPAIGAPPADPFLRDLLMPALQAMEQGQGDIGGRNDHL